MRTFLKVICSFFLLLLLFMLIHLSVKLYDQPELIIDNNHVLNQDVIKQLHFLKNEIHQGKADELQQIFPEGFIFFHVIYGLTWCELIDKTDKRSQLAKEAIEEIDWAIKQVNSAKGKKTFRKNLSLEYGAFYQGWTTLLSGKKLSLIDSSQRRSIDIENFSLKCEKIAHAFEAKGFSYLRSYSSGTWQADNIICLASLALHDRLFAPKYQEVINKCVTYIKTDLDRNTGLIPHSTDEKYPRGSSQSLINVFLPEIDSVLAEQQYVKFKAHFLDRRLGLVAIREFPKGHVGAGDIDSGPIIWDVGGVASIVGIKAMAIHKDFAIVRSLRNNIEGLSYPISGKQQKKYFFGTFPMADAFIAWANVTVIDEKQSQAEANHKKVFLLIAFSISALIVLIFYVFWKRKKN
ncbi:hypothetical protein [Emticicia agri]|uniref:Uncharacterized protein n=1 Tax=Emticicia agri TaxID=2492393 RepID=A0A4Q5M3L9_9BACT|nr:hypothetical protein [Emticicia agri]RYU96493.1 hypothetical protein EWM59_06680 [Emticicia agri]